MPPPSLFLALVAFALVAPAAQAARGEIALVPPPRPELDAGPPPLLRAPEHARKPIAIVPELELSLPLCEGPGAEPCASLGFAPGAALGGLYRAYPYFAFGARVSYFRSRGGSRAPGEPGGETIDAGALGRVYFYEEGTFDPFLELELGYGSLHASFAGADGARYELSAFGPTARIGGGLDVVVSPSLELGASLAFSHLLLGNGERCEAARCDSGSPPGGAVVGAFTLGLHAALTLGEPL